MLPTGLHRHARCGSYYLRRRIPSDLLAFYPGKKEVVFSLRTKDYRTAVERHRREEAKLTCEWETKRHQARVLEARNRRQDITRLNGLSPEDIENICLHVEAAALHGDEARRESEEPYTLEEVEAYRKGYAAANETLRDLVATGDLGPLRPLVEQFLQLYGYEVVAPEPDMRRLTLAYGRAAIRTNQKLLNRLNGMDEPTPEFARKAETPLLSEVTTAYMDYYEKLGKPSMLRKARAVMPLLVDIVGDKPIGTLKQADLEHYFEAVQQLPPRWTDNVFSFSTSTA